ncbi:MULTISPECIES: DUF2066 domain-containing protein [unclassified Mesorhizobium]|uniref:DUF2066 domain-containing protein n=1 Tax=unclassified Mesorhizobium TaxID=325217 RepID=UPI0015E48BDF|nr:MULTISPECIES: DUF2066 domain-containing protein [unclassified Mesorhizobium]MBZ9739653.1 DUF2066 domain-containing protein [Mesorhizobium sp. CO1-1-4]MBZ9805082.1 DUF2066 domain-containing protein [Mesorhizobium sp. ES1-6]
MKKPLLMLLSWFAFGGTAHANDDLLYRSSVIVTGDREETRVPAIPQGFELAAQKLTGNPDIAHNPAFASLATGAPVMVWSYTYHDRMFGTPIHDEQGTRDRPFDLTFQFDRKRMDHAMALLGEMPWLGARPKLALLVEVTDMARSYMLAADGVHGSDLRSSFEDASTRFAIPIIFAKEADLSAIAQDKVDAMSHESLARLQSRLGADAILVGHLDWETNEPGWHAVWRLPLGPDGRKWEVAGVNFDAAFRSAIGGAAKRLRPTK